MSATNSNATAAAGGPAPASLALEKHFPEVSGAGSGDGAQFRAALERYMNGGNGETPRGPGDKPSMGEKVAGRVANLAGEIKKDQQYISRLLEQAGRTGDSMKLMKAMVALHDYTIRVQAISRTVQKTTQAFEQLTKLQ